MLIRWKDADPWTRTEKPEEILRWFGRDPEKESTALRRHMRLMRESQRQRAKGDKWKLMMEIPFGVFYAASKANPDLISPHKDEVRRALSELWDLLPDCRMTKRQENPWRRRK